ncbi:DUF1349 domain-containing protein [Actinoplanes sp. NPDC023801]|uniref:DUF1349 domain-containing protein n=1 Tax=Actinoplanes sp. NPDC023801 TaxID=3154595 RepID=UPI0033EFFC91
MHGRQWLNEPATWSDEGSAMHAVTDPNTDFWQKTYYGVTHDSGHFYYQEVSGNFTVEVTLSGHYQTVHDQSGLMLRVDERNWIRAGVEFVDGSTYVSTVITRGFSDWSMVPWPHYAGSLRIRLTRYETALQVQCPGEGEAWRMIRLGYLDLPGTVQVGVMCCSPEREGFAASFSDFTIVKQPAGD